MGIVVKKPGVLTTVQDSGRFGYQGSGFATNGVMDHRAFAIANLLVDNDPNAPVLEFALAGPTLRFTTSSVFAITGADCAPTLDGKPIPSYTAIRAHRGSVLQFASVKTGRFGCIAFAGGGIDVPEVMGSRSTNLKCQIGGWHGRALKTSDYLPFVTRDVDYLPSMGSRSLREETKFYGFGQRKSSGNVGAGSVAGVAGNDKGGFDSNGSFIDNGGFAGGSFVSSNNFVGNDYGSGSSFSGGYVDSSYGSSYSGTSSYDGGNSYIDSDSFGSTSLVGNGSYDNGSYAGQGSSGDYNSGTGYNNGYSYDNSYGNSYNGSSNYFDNSSFGNSDFVGQGSSSGYDSSYSYDSSNYGNNYDGYNSSNSFSDASYVSYDSYGNSDNFGASSSFNPSGFNSYSSSNSYDGSVSYGSYDSTSNYDGSSSYNSYANYDSSSSSSSYDSYDSSNDQGSLDGSASYDYSNAYNSSNGYGSTSYQNGSDGSYGYDYSGSFNGYDSSASLDNASGFNAYGTYDNSGSYGGSGYDNASYQGGSDGSFSYDAYGSANSYENSGFYGSASNYENSSSYGDANAYDNSGNFNSFNSYNSYDGTSTGYVGNADYSSNASSANDCGGTSYSSVDAASANYASASFAPEDPQTSAPRHEVMLRVVPGPQEYLFTDEGVRTFYSQPFTVTAECDRMGYRLDGPEIQSKHGSDIITDGIAFGAVQVPTHGRPIIMLADRQTTGGYAKIGTVASVDIPKLVQCPPGSIVRFQPISVQEAQRLLREQAKHYEELAARVRRPSPSGMSPRRTARRLTPFLAAQARFIAPDPQWIARGIDAKRKAAAVAATTAADEARNVPATEALYADAEANDGASEINAMTSPDGPTPASPTLGSAAADSPTPDGASSSSAEPQTGSWDAQPAEWATGGCERPAADESPLAEPESCRPSA